ncbi:MAG: hypothetical protein R2857_01575 [Vampirovibrionales bacterium]
MNRAPLAFDDVGLTDADDLYPQAGCCASRVYIPPQTIRTASF